MSIKDFKESFGNVKDYRQEGKIKHKLIEILFIAVTATIGNAHGLIDV